MRILFAVILTLTTIRLSGQQQARKIEQELVTQFKKIQYWSQNNGPDSLQAANEQFRALLLDHCSKSPVTVRYEFKDLETEGLVIKTSLDGHLRIYSWDTRTGSAAPVYNVVYQYKIGSKVFSRAAQTKRGDPGRMYTNLYLMKAEEKVYYVAIYHAGYSDKDLYQGVKILAIDNDGLNDNIQLIRTQTGIINEMGFKYDFLSVADRPERPVKLIYYDEDDKKIHIPVVTDNGKVTKNFTVYQFGGEYFDKLNIR